MSIISWVEREAAGAAVRVVRTMEEIAPNPLDRLARERLGVSYLYPYQKLVVANVIEGRDQIVVLPTGAGKSLCFQLPALLLPGATIVVFPLRALIADQARRFAEAGTPCGVIQGGQSVEERNATWSEVRAGRLKVLLATPEVLLVPSVLQSLSELPITHLVVDEAHCVSEWGESFRPSYLELPRIPREAHIPRLSAFTATASPLVLGKIRALLFDGRDPNVVLANPDRPNISYSVLPTLSKEHALVSLARGSKRPLLVFCRSRVSAELTAALLRDRLCDDEVYFYHAGLEPEEKKAIERWFLDSADGVLTATCAYGLGIDKASIRTVIHRDVPPSVEAFLQESGRAGRDRAPAESCLLVSPEDAALSERIDGDVARERYRALLAYAACSTRCRRQSLLALLGAEPETCFGCDVCRGTAVTTAPEERALLAFTRANRRRYTPREAALILSGTRSHYADARALSSAVGWRLLPEWSPREIEEALQSLVASGRLALPKRLFWKHRLTTARMASSAPTSGCRRC